VNQREANTTVSVKDGDTIVLGGIMRKTVTATTSKVPILGDIPILGNLFKSTSKSDSKTELLVFLTPRIVRNPADAKANTERQKEGLSPELKKKIGG
jgi:type II secretory pathway component GspD/PulD (secretin)